MKTKSISITRNVVLPLMFGLVATMTVINAEAAVPDAVNIINGRVDVNQNGFIQINDDRNNVWLWCDDAAPYRVRIIDGEVDVTENNVIQANDDARNCDLTVENAFGVPSTREVDIIDGKVDVNGNGIVNAVDDLNNAQLFIDGSF